MNKSLTLKKIIDKINNDGFCVFSCFEKSRKSPRMITFVNPFSIQQLLDKHFIIESFDELYVDGMSLVYIYNKIQKRSIERYSFDYSSIADEVFLYCEKNDLKLVLIGSTERNIRMFSKKLKEKYSRIQIVMSHDGYFGEDKWLEIAEEIKQSSPHIVVIGMGSPLQEEFGVFLKGELQYGAIFTCGGFFHQEGQISSRESYYPDFINRYNLRFLFRVYDEPKLIKRYMLLYPIFYFRIIYHFFMRK